MKVAWHSKQWGIVILNPSQEGLDWVPQSINKLTCGSMIVPKGTSNISYINNVYHVTTYCDMVIHCATSCTFSHNYRATWCTHSRWLTTSCKPSLTLGHARLRLALAPILRWPPTISPASHHSISHYFPASYYCSFSAVELIFSLFPQAYVLPPDSTRDNSVTDTDVP